MFPLRKTLMSLYRARLYPLLLLCGLLAVILVGLLVVGITSLSVCLIDFKWAWINTLISTVVGIALGIGGWFMLPVMTVLVGGFFQDTVIRRVEAAFYPDSGGPVAGHFFADLLYDIRFVLLALLLNMILLPLYLLGIGFPVSILLNSYLLGREFFEAAAGYHLGKKAAKQLGRSHRMNVYTGGLVITLATLTPLINLFVPVLATVWMVHLYHNCRRSGSQSPETNLKQETRIPSDNG
ncbi:MAG: hypothetical protein CSA22_10735 [Deltaproteobacteria bacterium]|nr:MAG: hypothetical protein CSA22_10735 [Deltaproteobacteria bacterium]